MGRCARAFAMMVLGLAPGLAQGPAAAGDAGLLPPLAFARTRASEYDRSGRPGHHAGPVRRLSSAGPTMNVALTDDLQQLLRKKGEAGLFPSEEAVVETAVRLFLIEGPDKERSEASDTYRQENERLPGPFIDDEAMSAPGDLPRSGQEITCLYLHDVTRRPDLFPGD